MKTYNKIFPIALVGATLGFGGLVMADTTETAPQKGPNAEQMQNAMDHDKGMGMHKGMGHGKGYKHGEHHAQNGEGCDREKGAGYMHRDHDGEHHHGHHGEAPQSNDS